MRFNMGLSGIFVNVLGPQSLRHEHDENPFPPTVHEMAALETHFAPTLAKQLRLRDGKRSIDASVEVLAEYPDYIPWARAQNPAIVVMEILIVIQPITSRVSVRIR